ncbi:MAG TPA: hypothetical protein VM325_20045 [Alphaproteobacteria bacterium]|nr:hypothetical protein [Alphaproteobacteria bacterium]
MALITETKKSFAIATRRVDPGINVDVKGYVDPLERNFSPLVPLDQVRNDFSHGAGGEFTGDPPKIAATHSSAALVVNVFGPWRTQPLALKLNGQQGFHTLRFEERCPIVSHGMPPHLDLIAESESDVVAVESKCTEYLKPKSASFKDAYEKYWDDRPSCSWREAMVLLKKQPDRFSFLDAAQLIKHYMGLRRRYESGTGTPYRDGKIVLLYLYWEPTNAGQFDAFVSHRAEIKAFGAEVGDDIVEFKSLTYAELWDSWDSSSDPLAKKHVEWLRSRYEFTI